MRWCFRLRWRENGEELLEKSGWPASFCCLRGRNRRADHEQRQHEADAGIAASSKGLKNTQKRNHGTKHACLQRYVRAATGIRLVAVLRGNGKQTLNVGAS